VSLIVLPMVFAMVSSKLFIALAVVCGGWVKTAALHQSRDGTRMRSSTDLCGQLPARRTMPPSGQLRLLGAQDNPSLLLALTRQGLALALMVACADCNRCCAALAATANAAQLAVAFKACFAHLCCAAWTLGTLAQRGRHPATCLVPRVCCS
jgi:hypothetical protein